MNKKLRISDCGLRISSWKARSVNPQSAIHNPQSGVGVEVER